MGAEYDLSGKIIGAAMKVHRTLGPGFLEAVYQKALALELRRAGIQVEESRAITVWYEGESVGNYSADLFVEEKLIIENKAVRTLLTAHEVQLVHYLTATRTEYGLVLNFGSPSLEYKRKFRSPPADSAPLIL